MPPSEGNPTGPIAEGHDPTTGKATSKAAKKERPPRYTKPRCEILKGEYAAVGKDKYLGGALGPDGNIYAVPGNALRVLKINPRTGECYHIGPEFPGKLKWLRGDVGDDGCVYGIPCWASRVLRIRCETEEVELIGPDFGDVQFKWHGAVNVDGAMYCIPASLDKVLRINTATAEVETFGPSFPGHAKWYGGLLGGDGCIYGSPQNAANVIKITPARRLEDCKASTFGDLPMGGNKWHGGTRGADGVIYCVPANADSVLEIRPAEGTLSFLGDSAVVKTGRHRSDGKYKYLGGALGDDGCIYFFPSDADHVLKVKPASGDAPAEVTTVGKSLHREKYAQNKWQNGFCARDGCVYGIPLKAEGVIRIHMESGRVDTIGGPLVGFNKWEGGVVADDGCMYCMPMKYPHVLKIIPGELIENPRRCAIM